VHVVLATQNADLAVDVRPRSEAETLADAGYACTLVGGVHEPGAVEIDVGQAETRLYRLPPPAQSGMGQVRELGRSFARMTKSLLDLSAERPIDVIHTGNPPDNLWLVLRLLERAQGYRPRFVYDQHDVAPVLAAEKFGTGKHIDALVRATAAFERASFSRADLVVFANDEYERRARAERLLRGPHVTVPNGWRLPSNRNGWKQPGEKLVAYIGTINEQDCVTHLVEALALLPTISTTRVVVAGDGSDRARAEARAAQLGIGGSIEWLGWVTDRTTLGALSTSADVCVAPERDSSFNRLASFVKIVEYMSVGAATAVHRLAQNERLCADCVEYAADMSPGALAGAMHRLLSEPTRARRLGERARSRFDDTIWWGNVGAPRLVDAYEDVFGSPGRQKRAAA
jgi:glycosyltransferase involved in cell wall biosynthesis